MGRKKAHTPEEIVAKLRQAEVPVGQGKTVADAVPSIGVAETTYYRWRTEFGRLKLALHRLGPDLRPRPTVRRRLRAHHRPAAFAPLRPGAVAALTAPWPNREQPRGIGQRRKLRPRSWPGPTNARDSRGGDRRISARRHASPGPPQRNRLVRARSINASPRPFITACIAQTPKPLTCAGVMVGGKASSCFATTTSSNAGPG